MDLRRRTFAIATSVSMVGLALAVLAAPELRMTRRVAAAGGGTAYGSHVVLQATVGQSAVGVVAGGAPGTRIHAGFWTPDYMLTSVDPGGPPAARPALIGNAPNPFNPTTQIRFQVGDSPAAVRLRVHDPRGRLVRTLIDAVLPAGQHAAAWDGRDDAGAPCASGLYFCRLQVSELAFTGKMALVR